MSNKTLRETLPPMPKDCIYAFSSGLPRAVMSAYYSCDQMREYAVAVRQQAAAECAKICADLQTPKWAPGDDKKWYEIATLDCEAAIKARYGLDAQGVKG